jgi:hypothetical protein
MLSPILWAGLALGCVMLTSPARAAAAPDDRRASSAPANADSAIAGAAPLRDTPIKSKRTGVRSPPRMGARSSAVSKGGNSGAAAPRRGFETPRQGIQSAGGSADRVRALLNTQARGRPAGQTSRPMGSNLAAIGAPGLGGPGASKRSVMPVPKATAATTNFPTAGPRVQTIGRLGGPAVGRTNHSAAIDGTQRRPRF